MTSTPPDPLRRLLDATDGSCREAAWTAFLHEHSRLIVQVARSQGGDHDAAMDRYTFILEALRRDDFHRLRGYQSDGAGRFSTWLIVVVRRLCLDQHRHRYGRTQSDSLSSRGQRAERRNLEDLIGDELSLATLEGAADQSPDQLLLCGELRRALQGALRDLPTSDRLLLRLRFEDGLSVPEVARLMGEASPFRMYRRIDRLLAALRRVLQAEGIEDSVP
jgi:RNA polymerase sigma factor (sigma-70 family)